MINRLFTKLNNLSIKNKLFLTYLALIALPICLFMMINLYFNTKDSEQKTLYSLRQVLDQTSSFIEFKAQSVKSILDMLALNNTVQELVAKDSSTYAENTGFWIADDSDFSKTVFYTIQNNSDISKVYLYMQSGLAEAASTSDYILLNKVKDKKWYEKLAKSSSKLEWYPGDVIMGSANHDFISALRKIPSDQDINGFIGILRADMPVDTLRTTLEKSRFTQSTSAFLINSNKDIICTSGNTALLNNEDFLNNLSVTGGNSNEILWKTRDFNMENFLIAGQSIQNTDWKLVLAVPYKDILEAGVNTRNQMLLIFFIVAPLSFPLSFFVAGSATKRIRMLISHMKKAGQGDFGIDILPSNEDEIGQLTRNFNQMVTKMAILIENQFKLGRDIKSKELKALQAQINPHFLYNTLDLINWMSVKYKATEITYLVNALSRFYKLSLSKGEDFITLSDELKHVKSYVLIQNMRFSDNIHLEIDISEELLQLKVLKIILQPLVENSILHGILEKEEETGTIRINGELENDILILRIEDDGIGMSEDILQDIPSDIPSNDSHGYGVKNINERIKLIYGMEYGLSYISQPGIGTTAIIRIPAIVTTQMQFST